MDLDKYDFYAELFIFSVSSFSRRQLRSESVKMAAYKRLNIAI